MRVCFEKVFSSLISYQMYKDRKQLENLKPGDVCLIWYNSKMIYKYQYWVFVRVITVEDGIVRIVYVSMRPKDIKNIGQDYDYKRPLEMNFGVMRHTS